MYKRPPLLLLCIPLHHFLVWLTQGHFALVFVMGQNAAMLFDFWPFRPKNLFLELHWNNLLPFVIIMYL